MKNMVDIEVVLDDQYADPHVTIRTRTNTRQVENIISAIENVSDADYPQIVAKKDDKVVFVSQRDIIRAHTEGRKVVLETEDASYLARMTLIGLGEVLDPARFLRISQSEIINLYKVKCFDFNMAGTVGVEFDCGVKSWVSRRHVKQIREMLSRGRTLEV
ncbi:MAG: LytTR family transcriptional regulator [Lachnospiraceae bacterium]|nr:LytTR family transcriptional regulator [Lachnospiraceae bacterium]